MPLPAGLTPIDAGRCGLWLLALRSHKAASKRIAFPQRHVWLSSFAARVGKILTPWRIHEYPGTSRFLAGLCGVSRQTAYGWIYGKRLPRKHAIRLSQYLEQHASECEALARELRAYAAANAKPVRKQPGRPAQKSS